MKTLVLGASTNPSRYSNKAIRMLLEYDKEVAAIGRKAGSVANIIFETEKKNFEDIHTVTLYLNPTNQQEYYKYIIQLNPKRVIFNPGTENREFQNMLMTNNIHFVEACTLVMLRTNQF